MALASTGRAARTVAGRRRHPLRPRPARRVRTAWHASSAPWRERPPAHRGDRRRSRASAASRARSPSADGRVVHDAGGSEAQELAFALAAAVAYLRALRSRRHRARRRAPHDRVPADRRRRPVPDHREIPRHAAALAARRGELRPRARARFRRCRDRMAHDDPRRRLCEHPARDHRGVLGRRRRRRRDHGAAVHCRARSAATALRGALRATRSSSCWRKPASRMSPIPTAGAGWSEDLTDKLCRAAWTLFQEIEAAGGAAAALERGLIQKKVAAARAARERALAEKKEALIGASEYPGVVGRAGARRAARRAAGPAGGGDLRAAHAGAVRRAVRDGPSPSAIACASIAANASGGNNNAEQSIRRRAGEAATSHVHARRRLPVRHLAAQIPVRRSGRRCGGPHRRPRPRRRPSRSASTCTTTCCRRNMSASGSPPASRAGSTGIAQWTPQRSLEQLDKNGIQTAMLSISQPGLKFDDVEGTRSMLRYTNEYGARPGARPQGPLRADGDAAARRHRRQPARDGIRPRHAQGRRHQPPHQLRQPLSRQSAFRSGVRGVEPAQGDRVLPSEHAGLLRRHPARRAGADHRIPVQHRARGDQPALHRHADALPRHQVHLLPFRRRADPAGRARRAPCDRKQEDRGEAAERPVGGDQEALFRHRAGVGPLEFRRDAHASCRSRSFCSAATTRSSRCRTRSTRCSSSA